MRDMVAFQSFEIANVTKVGVVDQSLVNTYIAYPLAPGTDDMLYPQYSKAYLLMLPALGE